MTRSDLREIWRSEYVEDAYEDQTGKKHWGYVVYEQLVVRIVDHFPIYEGYSQKTYDEAGLIAVTVDDRRFEGRPNLVDFWGGVHWKETPARDYDGYWSSPRGALDHFPGYCYADGTAPVKRLLPSRVKSS